MTVLSFKLKINHLPFISICRLSEYFNDVIEFNVLMILFANKNIVFIKCVIYI